MKKALDLFTQARGSAVKPGPRQTEVELKFLLKDPEDMRRRLHDLGFSSSGTVFEHNIVFDTPGRSLKKGGNLLRLRQDSGVRLTYKEPPADRTHAGRFKVKQESELAVADFETMRYILNRLGFTTERVYEKYREHFSRGPEVSAELDRLPHLGFFLELEVPPDQMDRLAADLGLDPGQGLRENYFQLFEAHCRSAGLEPGDMRFGDERQGR
ncbi:MAG: class IV adenylate cyclase [Candidatus Glassbacteria bacterium]|nr:class IV adenylate cyclase [Candidatus Glassbacteria bacterium]